MIEIILLYYGGVQRQWRTQNFFQNFQKKIFRNFQKKKISEMKIFHFFLI